VVPAANGRSIGATTHRPELRNRTAKRARTWLAAAFLLPLFGGCVSLGEETRAGIYRVRPDGGALTRIAEEPAIPVWSPDGTAIAWAGERAIWFALLPDLNPNQVVSSPRPGTPAWKPDGSGIAFVDNEERALSIVSLDGGERVVVPLLSDALHENGAFLPLRNTPSWSPDGGRLVLIAWDGNGDEVYAVNADGRELRRISSVRASGELIDGNNRNGPTRAIADAARPDWSPNGELVAFALIPEVARSTGGLYLVDAEGGRAQRRQTRLVPIAGPSWSPDGRSLLFVARNSGGSDIYLFFPERRTLRNLTDRNILVPSDAAWSPDGLEVVFSADGAVYRLDVATERAELVADTPLVDLSPKWSPDGEWIAFRAEPDFFRQSSLPPIP
jgi:Tol biopolymer transport system component